MKPVLQYKKRKDLFVMKKLFISCPMKGRTEENIRKSMEKMHKIAEVIFEQKLEVLPSYIEDNPPENAQQSVWFLGKSIQLLSEADFFIGVDWNECFKGCTIERNVAMEYGIKSTFVNMHELMPDTEDIIKAHYRALDRQVKTAVCER